jgi:hypothetical protein
MDEYDKLEIFNGEIESAQKYCLEVSEKCQTLPRIIFPVSIMTVRISLNFIEE